MTCLIIFMSTAFTFTNISLGQPIMSITKSDHICLGIVLSSCFLSVDDWLQLHFVQHILSKYLIKLSVHTLKQYRENSCTNFHPFSGQTWLNCQNNLALVKKVNTDCWCITKP
jgi:hypothetical protein